MSLQYQHMSVDTSVAAYYATFGTQRIPFLVSPLFVDQQLRPQLVPSLKRAIDMTVDITGRHGLATATVTDADNLRDLARRRIAQASLLSDVVLLFLCQSVETADNLMAHLQDAYTLTLLRKEPKDKDTNVQ